MVVFLCAGALKPHAAVWWLGLHGRYARAGLARGRETNTDTFRPQGAPVPATLGCER